MKRVFDWLYSFGAYAIYFLLYALALPMAFMLVSLFLDIPLPFELYATLGAIGASFGVMAQKLAKHVD